jgi:hypothetical protein
MPLHESEYLPSRNQTYITGIMADIEYAVATNGKTLVIQLSKIFGCLFIC